MKTKICLFVVLFAFVYPVPAEQSDPRQAIRLPENHRALVLNEMRHFLVGLQQISDALSREDMESVAKTARTLGSPMTKHMPPELRKTLPEGFRMLGSSVHRDFDQIALDAEALGDAQHTLSQLADTLSKCVSCHSAYQFRIEGSP